MVNNLLTADAIDLGLFTVLVVVLRMKVVGICIVGGGCIWKDWQTPCGYHLPSPMAQVMSQATVTICMRVSYHRYDRASRRGRLTHGSLRCLGDEARPARVGMRCVSS